MQTKPNNQTTGWNEESQVMGNSKAQDSKEEMSECL